MLVIDVAKQPVTLYYFKDLLMRLLTLEMLNVEIETNQDCGLQAEPNLIV